MGILKDLALEAIEESESVLAEDFDVFGAAVQECLGDIERRLLLAGRCGFHCPDSVLSEYARMPSMDKLLQRLDAAVGDLRAAYNERRDFDAEIDDYLYNKAMERDD